jgi:D-3-phosphoglycerate dehydrogenase
VLIARSSRRRAGGAGDGFQVRHVDGADRSALLPALADADAVLIRSATQVDAEALAAAPRLKVVARAGIGLDNVDVPAATARGVMVVNAPQSNIVSAAEQAVALLLACARNLAPANAALKNGRWERSRWTGVEVADKVVGVVGLGRIGVLFAQRMSAFGTTLIAYDPYVAPARAAQIGVRLVSLEELLRESDFISIHLPKTPETVGLIGAEQLAMCKPTVRIVNAARGGLLDEAALADALAAGTVAGAGLDVYATEPCTDSPLFGFDSVVVAPHLGASTVEAQDKAGIAVARSVRLALEGDFVPDAVNVQAGGIVAEELRPALPLVEKLGRVFTALAGTVAASVEVEVRGEIAELDVSVLQLAALKGVFADVVEEQVTFVNAPALAAERGVEVSMSTHLESTDYRNVVRVHGVLPTGATVSVSGTLTGPARSRSWSRWTASTSSCPPTSTWSSCGTTTGPAWSAWSAPRSATRGEHRRGAGQPHLAGRTALMALTVDSAVGARGARPDRRRIGADLVRSVALA